VNKTGDDDVDVSGIIAELRAVQRGLDEAIFFLEQSPQGTGPDTVSRFYPGIQPQRTPAATVRRRRRAGCRRLDAGA